MNHIFYSGGEENVTYSDILLVFNRLSINVDISFNDFVSFRGFSTLQDLFNIQHIAYELSINVRRI